MIQTFHRVILTKCDIGEHHSALCRFLVKEFNLSQEKAEYVVRHPPAVLGDLTHLENVIFARKHLAKLDADCISKPVIKDKRLPFAINPRQLKWISKEFSKTLRACVDTSLYYISIEPSVPDLSLPSLLGKEEEIEDAFRYSDSVFVIDNTTFVLLGFASDRDGADVVFDKIVYCVENYIHRDAIVKIGLSVIPDDGKSFYELIAVAKRNIRTFKNDMSVGPAESEEITQDRTENPPPVGSTDLQLFSLCFNKARGKFYNELTELPPDILWGALSKISVADQKKFFLQLPHDSQLTPFLAEKIKTQVDETEIKYAKKTVRKVIDKMRLGENLKLRNENRKKISSHMSRVDAIFTMPSNAFQVYQIASNPESDIDDVVKHILLAPSLTIKILKIVNSPFYGLSEKISSIKEAVVMLGMEEVVNMAFGLSLSKSFLEADLKGVLNPENLWRHSMQTALIARYLCSDLHQFKNMGVFTAGLLHDLGKVYLVENFPDIYSSILEQADENIIFTSAVEQEILGIDHGGIGKLIGDEWNLPDSLVQAVAYHHQPSAAMSYSAFAAVIGFADYLANLLEAQNGQVETQKDLKPLSTMTSTSAMLKANQLFKVDHVITLRKLFPNFGSQFIEHALEASRQILKENAYLMNMAE